MQAHLIFENNAYDDKQFVTTKNNILIVKVNKYNVK